MSQGGDATYWKVDTAIRDAFYLEDVDGTAVTGKVQTNFNIDIAKNGTGNQAATGVVITEIDSSNNPGWYYFLCGTTGFVTDTGTYSVRLQVTGASGATLTTTGKYVVTSDGTGSGSSGAYSFTATVGDGRVTDGTSAVEGATVRITDASGLVLSELTTDSSGLWGPVWVDATSYVYAQKSGYAQSSGTLTVSGGTLTGPGADLEMTAASSAALTAGELWSYAKRVAKNNSGSLTDQIVKEVVNDALDMVSYEADWAALTRYTTLAIQGYYNTGDVDITQGSAAVTLATGTWPSWAASGYLVVGNKTYRVYTRDSDSQVTLSSAIGTDSATNATYILYQDSYTLPTDLLKIKGVHFGENWKWGNDPCSYETLVAAKTNDITGQSAPYLWCAANGKLHLWPYPTEDTDLAIIYKKRIGTLSSSGDTVDFDAIHRVVLNRAIDYQVAIRYGQTAGGLDEKVCERLYREAVNRCMDNDTKPQRILGRRDRSRMRYTDITLPEPN